MSSKLVRTCSALAAIGLSTYAAPRETVRAELTRLQKETGLTLSSFYRCVETVVFADRTQHEGKELLPVGTALEGAVSRDGMEIVFEHVPSQGATSLGIVRRDGSNLRDYPHLVAAYDLCWSYDKSKLVMNVQNLKRGTTPPNDSLEVVKLGSERVQQVDVRASVTSQCWSPDGKQIVYEADDSVRVYDTERNMWTVLAKGRQPTWSSDGNWIAFLDDDTYYAIRPSGDDRKVLFYKKGALTGLWWSPDSRIVAYVSRNDPSEGPMFPDVGSVRLRVRRLDDNSEDWVAQLSDAHIPSYQWASMAETTAR